MFKKCLLVLLLLGFCYADDNSTSLSSGAIKTYELEKVTIEAGISPIQKYNSGTSLNQESLNSNPTGNGDMTSALKVLPNVQYDNAQLSSNTPGEIDPANISISGGLFYQNNFQLDGFNMNNDLDPIGYGSGNGGTNQNIRVAKSQGFNIHTSLLDSIVVLDSNIGAAYGGFTGGVVEANIRNPRLDGWHFDVSYQHTSDKLTKYHIDEETKENFENSADENLQPNFTKHLIKASLEGWVNEKFGIIGAFSTTRSTIPLNGYSSTYRNSARSIQGLETRNQTRRSDNYYLKMIYNVTSDFSLEANLGYMPQFNTYHINIAKDSFYTMQTGGYQAGLKGLWDTPIGLWTNSLGYSFLENSRRSDNPYRLIWRYSADDKNWATPATSTTNPTVLEGGLADIDQLQHTLTYKSDMEFDSFKFLDMEHKFRVGGEFDYKFVNRKIVDDYYFVRSFSTAIANLNGAGCAGGVDLFGVSLCSTATTSNNFNGQYIKTLDVIKANETKLDVLAYTFYLEDDIKIFDIEKVGELNTRFGVRFDGDNYMDKNSVAPRFSLGYAMPWNKTEGGGAFSTRLSFGANRYYGRNLFSYRLYDSILKYTREITRANITSPWTESSVVQNSDFKFNKLNIPYSDELMVGVSQDIGFVNLNAKYIHREGKDEIVRKRNNNAAGGGYIANYYYYTNEGKSISNIISLAMQNNQPLQTSIIGHYFLLAFDYTMVDRAYHLYNYDADYFDDPDILYDGKIIKYSERPTDNFARPWTLRLNTTQTINFGKTKFLWNNFFRYRSGYDKIVLLNSRSQNWNTQIGNSMDQYGRYHFKGAFTWDMRVGFEFRVDTLLRKEVDAGTIYVNVDIINVLNQKNMTTIGSSLGNVFTSTVAMSESLAVPVYETGRQFWLQFGYKY